MNSKDITALARKIARSLFTDGIDKRVANRLVMEHNTHYFDKKLEGSGWCESAAENEIEKIIKQKMKEEKSTKTKASK